MIADVRILKRKRNIQATTLIALVNVPQRSTLNTGSVFSTEQTRVTSAVSSSPAAALKLQFRESVSLKISFNRNSGP